MLRKQDGRHKLLALQASLLQCSVRPAKADSLDPSMKLRREVMIVSVQPSRSIKEGHCIQTVSCICSLLMLHALTMPDFCQGSTGICGMQSSFTSQPDPRRQLHVLLPFQSVLRPYPLDSSGSTGYKKSLQLRHEVPS